MAQHSDSTSINSSNWRQIRHCWTRTTRFAGRPLRRMGINWRRWVQKPWKGLYVDILVNRKCRCDLQSQRNIRTHTRLISNVRLVTDNAILAFKYWCTKTTWYKALKFLFSLNWRKTGYSANLKSKYKSHVQNTNGYRKPWHPSIVPNWKSTWNSIFPHNTGIGETRSIQIRQRKLVVDWTWLWCWPNMT